jgi:glutathione synthase/RimK-type ligase-like ATP-grasp enzyme
VVGEEVFACEIICEADDYRYPDEHPVEVRPCQLPEAVEDRSRRMAAAMNLSLAGIDLRKTPDGEWYCFEVNPSPGFTYYENVTGQPIAQEVARLLAKGAETGQWQCQCKRQILLPESVTNGPH